MTIYQVTIQKRVSGNYWTNRYFVDSADIDSAEASGVQIVAAERAIHLTYVEFVSMRTSLAGPEQPNVYLIYPLQGNGSAAADGAIPLTICARALLIKGPGRPDAKFLRGCIDKGDIGSIDTYASGVVNAMETAYCAPLMAIGALCSEDGTPYTSAQISPKIAQHQLSRGTRKRITPIIPVS